jgi:hypothetical protein
VADNIYRQVAAVSKDVDHGIGPGQVVPSLAISSRMQRLESRLCLFHRHSVLPDLSWEGAVMHRIGGYRVANLFKIGGIIVAALMIALLLYCARSYFGSWGSSGNVSRHLR